MLFPITVTSDTVCPWCFIGKRNLEAALAAMPDIDAEVRWLPFQLDPGVPPEGMPYAEYARRRFGADVDSLWRVRARIKDAGVAAGIDFRFDRIERRPNTLDSHRLVHWAAPGQQQNRIVDALFRAFFIEGRDVGDREVLCAVAQDCGMDAEQVALDLAGDRDASEIRELVDRARRSGTAGVPSFRLADLLDVPGAQPPEVFERLIRRATRVIAEKRAG